jgi:hypothetical protein
MESAMDYPVIRKFFAAFFHYMPGMAPANFVGSKSDPIAAETAMECPGDPPFVLVAHGAGGQWEVYAKDFEHPLASFDERQAGCDFASNLAKTRENAIVLIRESQGFRI